MTGLNEQANLVAERLRAADARGLNATLHWSEENLAAEAARVDALAADVLGARVMGYDAKKILYLSAMTEAGMGQGSLEKISILGSRLDECSYRFKNSPLLHFSAALEV